jgi:hypothetical protein
VDVRKEPPGAMGQAVMTARCMRKERRAAGSPGAHGTSVAARTQAGAQGRAMRAQLLGEGRVVAMA